MIVLLPVVDCDECEFTESPLALRPGTDNEFGSSENADVISVSAAPLVLAKLDMLVLQKLPLRG